MTSLPINCGWTCRRQTSTEWNAIVEAKQNPVAEVDIAMVGKYVDLARFLHQSLSEALLHGGIHTRERGSTFITSSRRTSRRTASACLNDMDGNRRARRLR